MRPMPYGKWHKLDGGTEMRWPAGHVLGSAYVEIQRDEERYVFSGDLGSTHAPLLIETPESRRRRPVSARKHLW